MSRKRSIPEVPVPPKRPDLPIAPHPSALSDKVEQITVTMPLGVHAWLTEIVGAKYRASHARGDYRNHPSYWALVNMGYEVFAEREDAPADVLDRPVKKVVKKRPVEASPPAKKIIKRR